MKHSYAEQQPDVDELITANSELRSENCGKSHGRARHITEIEDIIQIGYTGLIVAAQNYTPLDGATFASYASIRIRGAIVDYLRKSSNLCRTTIQVKKDIMLRWKSWNGNYCVIQIDLKLLMKWK